MTVEMVDSCGCGSIGVLPPLTPERHQQLIKDMLRLCLDNVDYWIEKARRRHPDADEAEVVKIAHQHICAILNAESPDGQLQCVLQYEACIAAGNPQTVCIAQYDWCMGNL